MATRNRSNVLQRLPRVLKKHYRSALPNLDRTVLEQLVYACLLENSQTSAADDAFDALANSFFDWNEVRVTTIAELGEAVTVLADPEQAASRLRTVLQAIFESMYSFDLESMRKLNLGKASDRLKKAGASPFVLSYVTQTALGGHAIPVNQGAADAMALLGVIREVDRVAITIRGLDRSVTKSNGMELGSLFHQLGVDYFANRYSTTLHKVLIEIDPDVKEQLPNRRREAAAARKAEEERKRVEAQRKAKERAAAAKARAAAKKKEEAAKKAEAAKRAAAAKKAADKKKAAAKKARPPAKKPAKKVATRPAKKKKTAGKVVRGKKAVKGRTAKTTTAKKKTKTRTKKKSASTRISRRKPR